MFSLHDLPLARVPLLGGPTAIEPLGPDGAWVKREDLSGTRYGGNKVRKLEWLLGEALESGLDVLTLGTVGSNHLVATAVYGQAVGVRVQAVVAPQPDTPTARRNARILHAHAERIWVARTAAELPFTLARAWGSTRLFGGYPPAVFPIGGSSVLGCLGWVGGGLEIAAQVAAGELPAPDRIYVALGSGGTAAGLWLGLRLGGLASEVVAVRAAPSWLASPFRVRRLAGNTLALLRRHGAPAVGLDRLRIVDGQYGPGYARSTAAAEEASARAEAVGLTLESTYTSKAYAAMLAEPTGTRLFVHTANSRPLEPLLATALDEVPPSLAGLLRRA
ncbi:MAG: pyridoxal-phosphate dependent enzyme [Pseudomonadota bacterium]|nr:pyridoxal-phosphate dependent enzyme [Pseudomonadota bacterium]